MLNNKNVKIALIALALTSVTLTACENTWRGAGRDIENAGEDMQNDYN
jgi:predicted small secreted protein